MTQILFISMERSTSGDAMVELRKVQHHKVYSSDSTIDKLTDRSKMFSLLRTLHASKPIDLIIARGVMAGWLSLKAVKSFSIPLSVESFEPHADYMVEDGVWRQKGIRYNILRKAEKEQMRLAVNLSTVTDSYARYLTENEGLSPDKLHTVPCCVEFEQFRYNQSDRQQVRQRLGFSENHIVSIYTGKLGGIYLDDEAIEIILAARAYFGSERFRLIILSPDIESWQKRLERAGVSSEECYIGFVKQGEVVHYLSAADFAFSLHRPTPSKMGISPIKNGEYIANGLPVVIPKGIGDDSEIIEEMGFGVALSDLNNIDKEGFKSIDRLIGRPRHLIDKMEAWVQNHRSFSLVKNAYRELLDKCIS